MIMYRMCKYILLPLSFWENLVKTCRRLLKDEKNPRQFELNSRNRCQKTPSILNMLVAQRQKLDGIQVSHKYYELSRL